MNPSAAWLIPIAPMIACIVGAALAASRQAGRWAHGPTWIGLGIAAVVSLVFLATGRFDPQGSLLVDGFQWLSVAEAHFPVQLLLDPLSLTQVSVVTFVSLLVAIYSPGYMHGDPGYARYFAIFSGFVFAMTMLVLSSNLLVLYGFWELVGLCSYLLIGFWYQRPSASRAAKKAFLVNRIADGCFLMGILILWMLMSRISAQVGAAGGAGLLDFRRLTDPQTVQLLAKSYPEWLGWSMMLILIGALGKSAQLPLHVWLPDAMEGPTPVSALIHAATMVTAGVYLVCRMMPLMVMAPGVLMTAAWLGGITALLAALIALFQDDLKKVLAYSTVSQLGYMFLGLGVAAAAPELAGVAVLAAMFHLATHAFFKALLFLAAGNVMHAMNDRIDMREFSGLKKYMPKTRWLFAAGAAALAGIPLLSGFWSKDEILAVVLKAAGHRSHAESFWLLLVIGLITAFLTSLYTFRAYARTFEGDSKIPEDCHPHESTALMLVPMAVLAVGALLLGGILGPTGWLSGYLEGPHEEGHSHAAGHSYGLMVVSALVSLAGAAVAFASVKGGWKWFESTSGFPQLARQKFYIDELYDWTLVRPGLALGSAVAWFDQNVVGWLSRSIAAVPPFFGQLLRSSQTGRITDYVTVMAVGLVVLLTLALWR
jgi:NADH-quinone oxidoreductase subunit L